MPAALAQRSRPCLTGRLWGISLNAKLRSLLLLNGSLFRGDPLALEYDREGRSSCKDSYAGRGRLRFCRLRGSKLFTRGKLSGCGPTQWQWRRLRCDSQVTKARQGHRNTRRPFSGFDAFLYSETADLWQGLEIYRTTSNDDVR